MSKTELPKRENIDNKYKWHIEDIYSSVKDWEEEYKNASESIENLAKYKNMLDKNAKELHTVLKASESAAFLAEKLYVYASMCLHEDSRVPKSQELFSKAQTLLTEYMSASSFILPEITGLDPKKLKSFMEEKCLFEYKHFLENILRQKPHILSFEKEELLAETEEISASFQNIFSMLNDADMDFGDIMDENGNTFKLTKGNYVSFMESYDRSLRKAAFSALYDAYIKQKNTIASIYSASVKKDAFYSKTRRFDSSLEMALYDDNIPVSVYNNLISSVNKHLPLLHRYIRLRKKLLGVSELHAYDLYVPLVPECDIKIGFEEAKDTVLKALSPMGAEYAKALEKGLSEGWIDAYENEGKRGGAYSWGVYSIHPFVLLNHNDTLNSMFTIAHEMGHALHSYFTWNVQPYVYSGHKIFVAEVASTVNEALLMEYLLKNSTDTKTTKYLLNHFMDQFRSTFFRQAMFAEFEEKTHALAESGEALTVSILSDIYRSLNVKYFGEDIVIDDKLDMEWGRIPHFYNAFYVYQYATGYSAAISLSQKILKEGSLAVQKYTDFLRKGNSEYSIDLLAGAGVDMTTAEPFENAMKVFESLMDKMEELL